MVNELFKHQERALQRNDAQTQKATTFSTSSLEKRSAPLLSCEDAACCSQRSDWASTEHGSRVLDELHLMFITHSDAKERFTVLHDCCPAYVLLYDPDISIIRTIETYQASRTIEVPPVKVYFLLYGRQ